MVEGKSNKISYFVANIQGLACNSSNKSEFGKKFFLQLSYSQKIKKWIASANHKGTYVLKIMDCASKKKAPEQ